MAYTNDFTQMNAWGLPSYQMPNSNILPQIQAGAQSIDWLDPNGGFNSPMLSGATNVSPLATDPTFMQGLLGYKDSMGNQNAGWGSTLFGVAKAGLDGYLGLQQLGLVKDSLNFQKDAFSKQFENQRTLTNAELRDRQNARVASNPTAYQSTEDYMKANAV